MYFLLPVKPVLTKSSDGCTVPSVVTVSLTEVEKEAECVTFRNLSLKTTLILSLFS